MSFTMEKSKFGKSHIIYNSNKFRESYSLKNGEIVWRCLGKICKATIKTDSSKTGMLSANDIHEGPHPVTMQSMMRTPPFAAMRRSATSPRPLVRTEEASFASASGSPASVVSSPVPTVLAPRQSKVLSPQKTTRHPSTDFAAEALLTPTQSAVALSESEARLAAENCLLKREIADLKKRMKDILDHSIESDQLLLQYTNNVFVVSKPSVGRDAVPAQPSVRHQQTQTDSMPGPAPVAEHAPCPRCTILKEEAEKITATHPPYRPRTKVPLGFSSIAIEGDSHSRGLACLVKHMVGENTTVRGDCKPGAKLEHVVTEHSPLPGSCSVIIAGTNDIASGQQRNIYKNLERSITKKLRTANTGVVVSTLPYRHDLPACHPLHLETALVNAYIEELCARHPRAEVLDFNQIGRSAFTSQGMHLRTQCKFQLAELLVESVKKLGNVNTKSPPPPTIVVQPPTPRSIGKQSRYTCEAPTAALPRTLQYDTYAEALKSPTLRTTTDFKHVTSGQKNLYLPQMVQKG